MVSLTGQCLVKSAVNGVLGQAYNVYIHSLVVVKHSMLNMGPCTYHIRLG